MKRNKSGTTAVAYKKPSLGRQIIKSRILILMSLPAIIYFFLFSYMPLPGIYVAFV